MVARRTGLTRIWYLSLEILFLLLTVKKAFAFFLQLCVDLE
jgi:hypothetical protein